MIDLREEAFGFCCVIVAFRVKKKKVSIGVYNKTSFFWLFVFIGWQNNGNIPVQSSKTVQLFFALLKSGFPVTYWQRGEELKRCRCPTDLRALLVGLLYLIAHFF